MPESMITKRALAATMKTLMEKQPLSKITVGDICDNCGMSRKGFYYHFRDKFDLVNWIFYTDFIERVRNKSYENVWDFFNDICMYFYDNRRFYITAFQTQGQNSFAEYFADILQPLTMEYLQQSFAKSEHHDFYADFFTDAFRMAIIKWLREDAQLQPQEFVTLLKGAVFDIAQRAADTPALYPGLST